MKQKHYALFKFVYNKNKYTSTKTFQGNNFLLITTDLIFYHEANKIFCLVSKESNDNYFLKIKMYLINKWIYPS